MHDLFGAVEACDRFRGVAVAQNRGKRTQNLQIEAGLVTRDQDQQDQVDGGGVLNEGYPLRRRSDANVGTLQRVEARMRDSDSVGNHRVIRVFTFDNGVVIRINPRDVVPVGQMFQQVSNQLIPGDVLLMNQNILHVKKRCQRETVFRGRFFFLHAFNRSHLPGQQPLFVNFVFMPSR